MTIARIGTSGWAYKHWKDIFYPIELSADAELAFYSANFDTAEINYSFYKLPSVQSYENWRDETPDDFLFSVKASRYLTHMKKLIDPEEPWSRIQDTAGQLNEKLGPILFQFPERWKKNVARLQQFLEVASPSPSKAGSHRYKLTFEFRDDSWFCSEVYKLLEKHNAALCIADSLKYSRKDIVTADFVYFRYHGREPIYAADYSASEIRAEAKIISKLLDQKLNVFAYFNNDGRGHAIKNAKHLRKLLN
jgi:uncharacterized protein YecE (DUF72 family)